jgi:hypothetical protein
MEYMTHGNRPDCTTTDPTHVCPECRAGKHGNCDGDAWCNVFDEVVPCQCGAPDHMIGGE